MPNLNPTLQQLREERRSARQRIERLDSAIATLEGLLLRGARRVRHEGERPKPALSAAARERIAQAQRVRWAKARKQSQPARTGKSSATAPAKRILSLAARRKIADAQRARWARVRGQQTTKAA
jgi:hypothetical protein